jgi:hypothetical protein
MGGDADQAPDAMIDVATQPYDVNPARTAASAARPEPVAAA